MTSIVVTATLMAVLAFCIIDDLYNFKIRNEVIIALAVLFVAKIVAVGQYRDAFWHVGVAALMFVLVLAIYARGLMGGGDAKLLGMAFLWLDHAEWAVFSMLLAAVTLLYVFAARMRLVPTRGSQKTVMPFAPCIAGAWLLTLLFPAVHY